MFSTDTLTLSTRHPVGILSYRGDVAKILPDATRASVGGQDVLVVPHTIETTRVLRNIGIKAQSPILSRYDWAGDTPFQAQKVTAAMLAENQEAFVLNEMATGKTRAALFAFDYLRSIGKAQRALVVAPLSTLKFTWMAEIVEHLPHLRATILRGGGVDVSQAVRHFRGDIAIINHDGAHHREKALLELGADVVIVDELTAFKNATAKRSKAMRRIISRAKYRWGMTGTPTPQGPLDAYGQILLIRPGNMAMPYTRWADTVTEKVGTFKRIPRKGAREEVFKRMRPAVRFKRSDVVELPPILPPLWRRAGMSSKQAGAYKTMLSRMKAEFASGSITAANEAVKLNKLLQIASGFIYLKGGVSEYLDPAPRIETILATIEEASAKFILFSPYIAGVEMLAGALAKAGYRTPIVYGATSDKDRDRAFTALMTDKSVHGLVAHPRTMSHGLSLVAADLIVWSSPPPSLEVYQQANARISRPGQKNVQMIAHVTGTPVEDRIYSRLQANQSTQNALLEMFSLDTNT